jgi:hypothetical protein
VYSQCEFNTRNERTIIELLKDAPKQHTEILKAFSKEKKDQRSTVNKLLKKMETDHKIFKVNIDGKSFYRLDIFPFNTHLLFSIADQTGYQELLEVKRDILKHYPAVPIEKILDRHILLADPQHKGIIETLEMIKRNRLSYF